MTIVQKPKIKRIECVSCYKKFLPNQIVRYIWKKQNLKLDLCPNCFTKVYDMALKEAIMPLESMIKTGHYEQGARAVDFKSYFEKWARKIKDQI